jgi:hypothetical protein
VPATASNVAATKEDFALVVGINTYPTLGPNLSPRNLQGAVNDAKAVASWLVAEAGVPCENVWCLISEGEGKHCAVSNGAFESEFPPGVRPDFDDLARSFKTFVRQAIAITDRPQWIGRRFWVYMAGHGYTPQEESRDVCVFPANALNRGFIENLCATRWADFMARNRGFDEIVMMLDCCAEIYAGIAPGLPQPQSHQLRDGLAKRVIAVAASPTQAAYETADENGVIGGQFTRQLLKALSGGVELSASGHVTTSALRQYFDNVSLRSGVGGPKSQTVRFLEYDELDLVHVDSPTVTFTTRTNFAPGTVVRVLSGLMKPLGSVTVKAGSTVDLQVPAGLYKLVAPDGTSQLIDLGN